jgi:hypothetical protein
VLSGIRASGGRGEAGWRQHDGGPKVDMVPAESARGGEGTSRGTPGYPGVLSRGAPGYPGYPGVSRGSLRHPGVLNSTVSVASLAPHLSYIRRVTVRVTVRVLNERPFVSMGPFVSMRPFFLM